MLPMSEDWYSNIGIANSYTQAKEDVRKVVQLLQNLGFVLSLEKYQLKLTHEFTHLGLLFITQNMTLSLPWTRSWQ